jgi:hypothetical protein
VRFKGISDTIGSNSVANVRDKLQTDYPEMLIIELLSLAREPTGIQLMTIWAPKEMPCPALSVEEK